MLADRYVWNALRNKLSFILNISYSFFLFLSLVGQGTQITKPSSYLPQVGSTHDFHL